MAKDKGKGDSGDMKRLEAAIAKGEGRRLALTEVQAGTGKGK